MCIMCEVKKKLAAMAGIEIKETILGTLTVDQFKELNQLEEAQELLDGQIDKDMRGLVEAGTEKEEAVNLIAEKYEKKYYALKALKKKVTDDIFSQYGIDHKVMPEVKVDKNTRQIIHETAVNIDTAPGVH
jgi:hypothetical protein